MLLLAHDSFLACKTHNLENPVMYLFHEAANPGHIGQRSFMFTEGFSS